MGRTLPTQVQLLQDEESAWKPFRRALRKEDQEAFDAIWAHARFHSVPAGMASRLFPFEAYCLAMMVGLQRDLIELKKRLAAT